MALHVLCVLLVLQIVNGNEIRRNEGFMDHLNTGMKFAQNFLGSESVALKVADFVVRAFQTVNSPSEVKKRPPEQSYDDDYSGSKEQMFDEKRPDYMMHEVPAGSPWRHLVRLLGLQPNQISAVAVNALVFVAQMITTFLAGPRRPSKPFRSDDPMDWILSKKSKKLQELIATAKNESLPDLIEELIQHENEEETSCIRLLVCKVSPFVVKMQKAVFGKENETDFNEKVQGAAIMYRHLPSKKEINDRSDVCEQRYKECDLNE